MRLVQLKIKIKSLAAEARIIRHEEKKCLSAPVGYRLLSDYDRQESLYLHRIHVVRAECRHSLLAYGFLRGTPYRKMESTCRVPPRWSKVEDIARRFGGAEFDEDQFKAWRKEVDC